jgi:carbonic anhydrase
MSNMRRPDEQVDNWQTALTYLKEGNLRFVRNQTINRSIDESDRAILKDGQRPIASIITCSDSRVSPEIFFDQRMGDIFVVRNAGNTVDSSALGSIEFAVKYLLVPLVVVVGHSECGAVHTAFESENLDGFSVNLQSVLRSIRDTVSESADAYEATIVNLCDSVAQLRSNDVIRAAEAEVIGAYYDIGTGKIDWLP